MSVRSNGRSLSFEILSGYLPSSGEPSSGEVTPPRSKRKRKPKKKKHKADGNANATLETIPNSDDEALLLRAQEIGFKELESRRSVCGTSTTVVDQVHHSPSVSCVSFELRQRNVNGGLGDADVADEVGSKKEIQEVNVGFKRDSQDVNVGFKGLEKEKSLDWNQVMKENPGFLHDSSILEKSPVKYFMGEVYSGNSLRSTISVGNEKKRQRVYNSMFHVPWRCERLIVAGFFVCLDSFLSLLTIMPARILMTIWKLLKTRQLLWPNAAELADFGCFIVLGLGVTSLQMIDISLIYHVIRGQGTIKLYVVYNVLEIFDKLCQSFGEDVLQVLFNSAEGLSTCSKDNITSELMQFILDEAIAVIAFVVHSFVLLAQAITLSTCIIAHNNALLALLVSNNFAEIKSNVFKRVSKENLHNLVYYDIIERFHITAFLLFVLAQNLLEAEGPWLSSFFWNALEVYVCEILIDAIKHSFLAKFNEIKPVAYSEFLEDLCRQILNDKPDERQKDLTFIPLAPACVVIRVLTPVYATLLPYGPFYWRFFWIIVWSSLTYIMLAIFKTLVILLLRFLATWYVNLRLRTKQHVD
ncbi:Protein POLLEN DEFECTIVE IN GUIDANCE 1 [Rhynchospora pubera]|uniref:Protein POLLEN DEFECTIVE IN GUIDANCE 1 n=1 Tax=Rhynchospora pubera TaxID=906938 RepID=A0AAV8D3X2_9POAL|nr:Protein POLLEN DEFECTIVE IN GUIDANCE 1 [Rhynchospora pubera]